MAPAVAGIARKIRPGPKRSALICQDQTNTKAAYRFLSNKRVSKADILAGHFDATRERIGAIHEAPVLMLHDRAEFSWQRDSEPPRF